MNEFSQRMVEIDRGSLFFISQNTALGGRRGAWEEGEGHGRRGRGMGGAWEGHGRGMGGGWGGIRGGIIVPAEVDVMFH